MPPYSSSLVNPHKMQTASSCGSANAMAQPAQGIFAGQPTPIPNLSANPWAGGIGVDFVPVLGSPPILHQDPAHPFVPNGTGAQPTYRVADLAVCFPGYWGRVPRRNGFLSEILAAHHRMASQPMYLPDDPTTRNNDWAVAHIAFHYKLIEACGNEVLLDICLRLSDAAELYRAWSGGHGDTRRDVAAEHVNRACMLLRQHPIFVPLLYRAEVVRRDGNLCPPDGWAVVTANGQIHVHPTRRAQSEEWLYVLAHCLLHLGFVLAAGTVQSFRRLRQFRPLFAVAKDRNANAEAQHVVVAELFRSVLPHVLHVEIGIPILTRQFHLQALFPHHLLPTGHVRIFRAHFGEQFIRCVVQRSLGEVFDLNIPGARRSVRSCPRTPRRCERPPPPRGAGGRDRRGASPSGGRGPGVSLDPPRGRSDQRPRRERRNSRRRSARCGAACGARPGGRRCPFRRSCAAAVRARRRGGREGPPRGLRR